MLKTWERIKLEEYAAQCYKDDYLVDKPEESWYGITLDTMTYDINIYDGDEFGDEGKDHCIVYRVGADGCTDTSEAVHLWTKEKGE